MACKSCACGNKPNHLRLPPRGPWDQLASQGVRRTCESDDLSVQVTAPVGWTVAPSAVSVFHQHLLDADGNPIACLLTGPGKAGSFQLTGKDNCAAYPG